MDIRYSGSLTKDDYLALLKLNSRPILKKGGFHFDFWVLFAVIGVILVLLSVASIFYRQPFGPDPQPWNLLELVLGTIMLVLGLKIRAVPSRFWEENKDSISMVDGRISDDGIEVHTANGDLTLKWPEISGYGDYGGLIVLYKLPAFALPFLERFFENHEDWLAFRRLIGDSLPLTHHVEQRGIARPGSPIVYVLLLISVIVMLIYYFAHGG